MRRIALVILCSMLCGNLLSQQYVLTFHGQPVGTYKSLGDCNAAIRGSKWDEQKLLNQMNQMKDAIRHPLDDSPPLSPPSFRFNCKCEKLEDYNRQYAASERNPLDDRAAQLVVSLIGGLGGAIGTKYRNTEIDYANQVSRVRADVLFNVINNTEGIKEIPKINNNGVVRKYKVAQSTGGNVKKSSTRQNGIYQARNNSSQEKSEEQKITDLSRFNDIFDNIFLTPHLNPQRVGISFREKNAITEGKFNDLSTLVTRLLQKMDVNGVPFHYSYYFPRPVEGMPLPRQRIIVDEVRFPTSAAGRYNPITKEITVNKKNIETDNTEKLLEIIAEECYHAFQHDRIIKYQDLMDEKFKYQLQQHNSNTYQDKFSIQRQIDRINESIEKMDIGEKKINQWKNDWGNYPDIRVYNEMAKRAADPNTTQVEKDRLKRELTKWENRYEGTKLESDAKEFAKEIVKIYKRSRK